MQTDSFGDKMQVHCKVLQVRVTHLVVMAKVRHRLVCILTIKYFSVKDGVLGAVQL